MFNAFIHAFHLTSPCSIVLVKRLGSKIRSEFSACQLISLLISVIFVKYDHCQPLLPYLLNGNNIKESPSEFF